MDPKFELSKNKFSFNNIHMNLGNVKYSSTSRSKVTSNIVLDERSIRNKQKVEKFI